MALLREVRLVYSREHPVFARATSIFWARLSGSPPPVAVNDSTVTPEADEVAFQGLVPLNIPSTRASARLTEAIKEDDLRSVGDYLDEARRVGIEYGLSGDDVEDVAQAMVAEMLTDAPEVTDRNELRAYLREKVASTHQARLRQRQKLKGRLRQDTERRMRVYKRIVEDDSRRKAITEGMAALSEREVLIIYLRAAGLSISEVAAVLEQKSGHVKFSLRRALVKLRGAPARRDAPSEPEPR